MKSLKTLSAIRSRGGFSLVKLLVVAAIMGVIALGGASMLVNQQRELTRNSKKANQMQLIEDLRVALSLPESCKEHAAISTCAI